MPRPQSSTMRALRCWAASGLLLVCTPLTLGGQSPAPSIPFTQAQAAEGGRVYTQKCAACHGTRLDDGAANPLSGPRFLSTWTAPARSLDDLFFIIRSTMPKNEGGTLTQSDYLAVLAYILDRNGYRPGSQALSADRTALASLRLTRPAAAAEDRKTPPPAYIAGDGGTSPRASGPTHEDLLGAANGRDWLMHTHDYSGTRYSPLAEITSANAPQLRAVCEIGRAHV